ncbi:hypothetical protein [Streptomyces sviceus]|uniref:hypothetical protein n=1 Tax=Streptomyces sviceus TaxID=285530 RepID=UPI0036F0A722
MEGRRSPLLGISAEEATALPAAASGSGPLERIALGDALVQARLKLLASLPAAGREHAATTASRFHIDTRGVQRVVLPVAGRPPMTISMPPLSHSELPPNAAWPTLVSLPRR